MCQRPERAFFISTRYCDVIRLLVQKCVNALNGLFSFLPRDRILGDAGLTLGVNALNGLFSFLPCNTLAAYKKARCVNALNGLFSFLRIRRWFVCHSNSLCQRPERAFFISTVPSQNPHKHWLCRLIFAVFTVYSYFQLIFQPLPYKHYTLASSKMKVTFLISISTLYLQPLSSISN